MAVGTRWHEIVEAVSTSMPEQAPELWLGQLVLEAQGASDRAVAAARARADALIAEARAEALDIRQTGRRRARAITELRAAIDQAARVDADLCQTPLPSPPRPRPAPVLRTDPVVAAPTGGIVAAVPAPEVAPPRAALSSLPPPPPLVVAPPGAAVSSLPPLSPPLVVAPPGAAVSSLPPPPPPPGPPPAVAGSIAHVVGRLGLRPRPLLVALVIVAAAVGLPMFEHYGTAARERASQHRLAAQFATLQAQRGPIDWPFAGGVLGYLDVPRISIDEQAVVDGATLSDLRRGPARDSSSQLPGHPGAVVLLGRRSTYGGPFGRIGQLQIGDVITLRTPAALYAYRVSRNPQVQPVGPGATLQLPAGQGLVLATSVNSRSRSLEVVVATPDPPRPSAAGPAARPARSPATVVTQLVSVAGQPIGMALLVVWLAVALGVVWLGRRLLPRLTPAVVYGFGSVIVLVSVYQMYLAIDRLVPGTY